MPLASLAELVTYSAIIAIHIGFKEHMFAGVLKLAPVSSQLFGGFVNNLGDSSLNR